MQKIFSEDEVREIYGISKSDWLDYSDPVKELILDGHRENSDRIPYDILKALFLKYADLSKNLETSSTEHSLRKMYIIEYYLTSKSREYSKIDLVKAKAAMNASHEGMEEIKNELLREVAGAALSHKAPRPILLVGEPGCGKTSLAISLAKALDRGFDVISLSGLAGIFELKGESDSWTRAKQGKILNVLYKTGRLDPVIIFDELDKLGTNKTYGNTQDAFLDLLEDDRKKEYVDEYVDAPFDLSRCWTIFTANTLEGISEPLLDRLRVIHVKSYDFSQMTKITKRMINMRNKTIAPKKLLFSDLIINDLVSHLSLYSYSARPIRDAVDKIFSFKSIELLEYEKKSATVTKEDIQNAIASDDVELVAQKRLCGKSGVVNGIAVGYKCSFLSPIEVSLNRDERGVYVMGNCGDMMTENAVIASTFVEDYVKLHYNDTLGRVNVNYITSIKKNGDSASLATSIAILSEYLKEPVLEGTAITGALSLKGLVLEVGMVDAKIDAAIKGGMKRVIIPREDKNKEKERIKKFSKEIEILYASTFEEAISYSFKSFNQKDYLFKEIS